MIGSQACRPCHPAVVKSYAETPMARSSGPVESIPLAPATFTAAGWQYRISENQLRFKESGAEISVPLSFFIGSGTAGRSFLFARDRYLFELPVTWYAHKNAWDASPGYESERGVKLDRAVEPSCLFCHSSQVQPIFGTQNRYGEKPFLEGGVSCERCHGPGSEHVRNPQSAPMVNPAALAPALRDSVCSQCHLTGDARIERPGRRIQEFRAGDLLSSYATYFVRSRAGASRGPVTGSGNRARIRSRSAVSESTDACAAASSIASGRPSRCRQMSAASGEVSSESSKAGFVA